MVKIKWILITVLLALLVYTRFVNISWGLPYPLHPDERNMANAIQGLNCQFSIFNFQFSNCFNPHFFAYGQLPLYLSYFIIQIYHLVSGQWGVPISYVEAVIALRIISASASIITTLVLLRILRLFGIFEKKNLIFYVLCFLLITFSPALVQLAHFGTTESLLMLFYSLIICYSLKLIQSKTIKAKYYLLTALFSGLAMATKVSSFIFILVPLTAMLQFNIKLEQSKFLSKIVKFIFLSFLVGIIFSPHNLISFDEFISSLRYESSVATGTTIVFYTRQFMNSIPILFQFEKIFPYALGWPAFGLGLLGLLGLDWRDKEVNLLRLALFVYFLPNAILFAKWTRFMAPIFPLLLIFAALILAKIKINIIKVIIVIIAIIPGIAYLSVYTTPDVRLQATDWIYKNISKTSYILSETGNVVDLPLSNQSYRVISFDFYDLDYNPQLSAELKYHLSQANYIIVPSRRIFMNHPKDAYPLLNNYYRQLFSGSLGFKQVAEFTAYPKIKFQISNFKFQIDFPDEQAEETWSVFDHPVIRIYKKV